MKYGALVLDLGVGPEIWLFLTLVGCITLFFKFSRVWSIRNLDLLLLFAPAPGLMLLVGNGDNQPWIAFVWLFMGSMLWLTRALLDLGLTRRPLLEPNLNAAGLACLSLSVLGLIVTETVSIPVDEGAARNPADPGGRATRSVPGTLQADAAVDQLLELAPLPISLKPNPPQVILSRVLASLGHLALVTGLIIVGWRHFERPISGLAVATCYLVLPYPRIGLLDSGQVIPAALIVWALMAYAKPSISGVLIGFAAGWMPACVGLIPLWAGFYRKRGLIRFISISLGVVAGCCVLGALVPGLASWARALGARSLAEAGLLPGLEPPVMGSFWSGIDGSFRLPVLIAYLALVSITTLWPAEKNLGELIALSAAVLIASQFWYIDKGGTLILLYLPLVLLMMFRPNLAAKRLLPAAARQNGAQRHPFPDR